MLFAQNSEPEREVFDLRDFGVTGEGIHDDGPAIRSAIQKIAESKKPSELRFPPNGKIRIESGALGTALSITALSNMVIDGGGSTIEIDPMLRFLSMTLSRNIVVKNLTITTSQPVAVDGVVQSIQDDARTLVVRIDHTDYIPLLKGSSGERDEQAFFGLLWVPGAISMESKHLWTIEDIQLIPGSTDQVNVTLTESLPEWVLKAAGKEPIHCSLPVSGTAHRLGSGAMIRIDRCRDVMYENVEVNAAAWFAFQIFRNDGDLVFRKVHVRPAANGKTKVSSWRDGFHVKGNSGSLLFEDCVLDGLGDDAFNVSTHAWKVIEKKTPDTIRIQQIFPLQMTPPSVGGKLLALAEDESKLLPSAGIMSIEGLPAPESSIYEFGSRAVELTLKLDRKASEIEPGTYIWDLSTANPKVTIRRCKITQSCRFQSPVELIECETSAFLWFYHEEVEGPFPSGSVIRNCILRQGRGNQDFAVSVSGWKKSPPEDLPPDEAFPIHNIQFLQNQIHGKVHVSGVNGLVLIDNSFHDGRGGFQLQSVRNVTAEGNTPEVKFPKLE